MKTFYWSRIPGNFVNKNTGDDPRKTWPESIKYVGPKFTGTVREWYETLVETTIDMRNQLGGSRDTSCTVEAGKDAFIFYMTSVLIYPTQDKNVYELGARNSMQIIVRCSGNVGEIKILDAEFL